MPAPYNVASFNGFGDVAAFHGPFQYGTNLYLVLVDRINHVVKVMKSSDYGENWTEQDSGSSDKPAIYYAVSNYQSISVLRRNTSELWVSFLYPTGAKERTMRHQKFDMATDAWGGVDLQLSSSNQAKVTHPAGFTGVHGQFYTVRRYDGSSGIGSTNYANGFYTYDEPEG